MSRKGNLLGYDAGLIARKGEGKEGSLCRRGSACSIVLRKVWPCQWGVPEPNGLLLCFVLNWEHHSSRVAYAVGDLEGCLCSSKGCQSSMLLQDISAVHFPGHDTWVLCYLT